MYIQIDPRCPMGCAHCGYSCTAKGYGEFSKPMTMKVYKAALKFASQRGDYITLGGGEPTLHPKFKEMLILAIAESDSDALVSIITSGCHTENALLLAKLAKAGVIGASLSLDKYHPKSKVAPEVVRAFMKDTNKNYGYGLCDNDYRDIRTVQTIIPSGRGADLSEADEEAGCICEEMFVAPDGSIRLCGCIDSPVVGHVLTGILPEWEEAVDNSFTYDFCHKNLPEEYDPRKEVLNVAV